MYVVRTTIVEDNVEKNIFAQNFNVAAENKEYLNQLIEDFYNENKDINKDFLKLEIFNVACDLPEKTKLLLKENKDVDCYVNLQYRENCNQFIPLVLTLDENEYEEQNIFIAKVRMI